MSNASLDSVQAVIDALGGPTKAARIVGRVPQSIVNCRATGYFPPNYFLAMNEALKARGFTAAPRLWRQTEPIEAAQ